MSVNMFEVEGWRLKAEDKNHSLPKTSSDLRSVLAKAGAILKPQTILSSPQTSNLKQCSAMRYAPCSMRLLVKGNGLFCYSWAAMVFRKAELSTSNLMLTENGIYCRIL
jgi:hypothetical protein